MEEPNQLLEPEPDKFSAIDQFIHDIDETDDAETVEAKQAFNDALISNTELEMLHRENIEHGMGSNIEDIWTLRRDADISVTQDLDFMENMEKISQGFAHNQLVEDLDRQLPVLTPRVNTTDRVIEDLTAGLADLEVSTPKHKTEENIINIESSEDQDPTPTTDVEANPILDVVNIESSEDQDPAPITETEDTPI